MAYAMHTSFIAASVMDAALDLILAAEVLAETREEDGRTAEAWERRIAEQQAAYWARREEV